ncbi:putative beta-lysine N-acetyltransferase [Desulfosarcina sp.]|uniref:putative beta-lysine N-acetyltransferase n=1 Tax=Desulfosarcina sp. TaxID=2027861 RepID=UPI0029A1B887|nr:putative beta-lysine N-acetyltransferase [Desulfosarcina sp.]MDX2452322.1 putative beta-lysine N-acetyltransferase [Desulfosarcina sp.]MDX2490102.1 putative beta-lysine N-acetyltransferase [Desulfosarcina sp.]
MADKIETIDGSVIQHGFHNDRIYLMHLQGKTAGTLILKLDRMAKAHGYGKIFAKIPANHWKAFKLAGYTKEAVIPSFFRGTTDGLFIAKFLSVDRQRVGHRSRFDPVERISKGTRRDDRTPLPVIPCTPSESVALGKIYRQVFESYPFPIHQPEFLNRAMQKSTSYFCIQAKKKIVAAAAAEIDSASKTCEMTDFATLPEYRGNGFAGMLLNRLDDEAQNLGMRTAYTIARADSYGMNRIFKKMGYRYAGRLVKNSQIGGRIRSMNVWHKPLR